MPACTCQNQDSLTMALGEHHAVKGVQCSEETCHIGIQLPTATVQYRFGSDQHACFHTLTTKNNYILSTYSLQTQCLPCKTKNMQLQLNPSMKLLEVYSLMYKSHYVRHPYLSVIMNGDTASQDALIGSLLMCLQSALFIALHARESPIDHGWP